MPNVINFRTYEQQPLAVTGVAAAITFTSDAAKLAPDCMIVNYGTAGAQVSLTGGAVATNSAGGTSQVYVAAGAILVVAKNSVSSFSAITDGGTTSLIFHAGSGS